MDKKVTNVEFPITRVMAVRRDSPAWDVIARSIPIKPGLIIPVSQEELDSLREDCLILDVLPDSAEASHKFPNVSCSQCGQDFGPGEHGFSHCANHAGQLPILYSEPASRTE